MVITTFIVQVLATSVMLAFSPDFQDLMLQSPDSGLSSTENLVDNEEYTQMIEDLSSRHLGLIQIIATLAALPWLLFIRGKKLFTHDFVVVNQKANPLSLLKILVLMLGVACASSLVSMVLEPLLEQLGLSLTDALSETFEMLFTDPLGVVYAMLLGPIFEEIIFRGAILNRLSRHGHNFAIVTSALLFGAYHMFLIQGFNAFFLGVILAYVASRYSLKWSMVLHIVYNSIVIGVSFLGEVGIDADIVSWVLMGLCLVITIVMLIIKRKEIPRVRQMGLPQTPRPFRIAFTSPFLIILLVGLLGMGFIFMIPGVF